MLKKIIIDCDTGVDDSIAILFALNRKDVEVIGISSASGNTDANQAAENTLRLLKLAGREGEIPVCIGATEPLKGPKRPYPELIHGANGIGNVILPESAQRPVDMDVRDFLYKLASENEGEVTLVTLGEATNIALTLEKYPDFSKKIKNVVAMGGSIFGSIGNVGPAVEANVKGDPEAFDEMIMADWDVTMVGLDVTTAVHLKKTDVDLALSYCRDDCRNQLEYISKALVHYMRGARIQNWMRGESPLHDPLAMIVAVDPSVVRTQKRITRIECEGKYTRGLVVTDQREYPIEGRYVTHCVEVNENKALNVLFAAFQESLR
ncbi:MAG: nucleoside hydrolase [Eubacteriales bacterium]|nr:nucleoside hydrolase [Eubacteriales bacterium]